MRGPANGELLVAGVLYLIICTDAFPEGELRVNLAAVGVEAGGGED